MLVKTDRRPGPNSSKRYHAFCDCCGADRGFLSEDGTGLCYRCAIERRNAADPRFKPPPTSDFITKDGERRYRAACPRCGADRGYQRKRMLEKLCVSCAARDRNRTRYRSYDPSAAAHRRLRHAMKCAISRKLRSRGLRKDDRPVNQVLPYTIGELKSHIESLFQPGMSWDNYGEWEIDHITPDSWFQYNSIDDAAFKQAWALSNLQPMWANANRRKGNRYSG